MNYRSKIGSGIVLLSLIWLLLTLASFLVWAIFKLYIPCIICVSILLVFILPIFINTKYKVKDGYLFIHFGLFVHKAIACYNIVSITNAQSIAISPALSSERLRIKYVNNGKIKSIYISPVDQDGFRNAIQEEIELNFKKAQISQDQVDKTQLEKVLSHEAKAQEKMDQQRFTEEQKQSLEELKNHSIEMLKLEKRTKAYKEKQYKTEHYKAVRQANAEFEAEILNQIKYDEARDNMKTKQLNELVAIHDKQEKAERKKEYKLWEEQKKEKERKQKEYQQMLKHEQKEREKLEQEARKNIEKLKNKQDL